MSDYSQQLHANDISECPALTSYHALDPARQEIRLIRLTENIEVKKFSLQDAPPYHAISYYWGPPKPKRHVRVGDEPVEVRESVTEIFNALRARYGYEEWYWMDIFCINQHDLAERNSQVSFMTEIYSHAVDVLSWLGPSTPQSSNVFRLISKALRCPQNAPPRFLDGQSVQPTDEEFGNGRWPTVTELEADQELYRRFAETIVWPAFDDILARPYWSRMWVVQEVIVAKQSYLLCGADFCSLDVFAKIGNPWVRKGQICELDPETSKLRIVDNSKSQQSINTWVPLKKLIQYRRQYRSNEILLMEIVDSYAIKRCTNILDKVYALRALSPEAATITVDYSKSAPEVFLSLVQSGLLQSDKGRGFQSLPVLARCMGIDRDELGEILGGIDEVLIPIDAILIGRVLHRPEKSETLPNRSVGIDIVSDHAGSRTQIVHRSDHAEDAENLLSRTQVGDFLCIVPTKEPILLLLRPHQNQEPTVFQAIANTHHWASEVPDETLKDMAVVGRIFVENSVPVETRQRQRLMISSRSLPALFMWKATTDQRYDLLG